MPAENTIPVSFTATYGTFDLNLQPHTTIDVTNAVSSMRTGNMLTLPTQFDFGQLPAGTVHRHLRFLQIDTGKRSYYIADDPYSRPVVINLADMNKYINVVYYLYISPDADWRGIISGQLMQLKSYGILPEANLYIHITNTSHLDVEASELIRRMVPDAILSFSAVNQYEYPGIKLVYDLAVARPDCQFLYFHSKGMSYRQPYRSNDEITLLTRTFSNWRKNMQYLGNQGVQKIGLFPAAGDGARSTKAGEPGGWIWYNFWYATGNYLSDCPDPQVTPNRYYYEEWLGMRKGETKAIIRNDCQSLYKVKVISKTYFSTPEAIYHMHRLVFRIMHNRITKKLPYLIRSSYVLHLYLKWRMFWAALNGKKIE